MKLNSEKGAALVEMAIALVLLFTIVFGAMEGGRMMYITNTLNNAAREGARRAVVSPKPLDTTDLDARIKDVIPFDQTGLNITIDPLTPAPGAPVTVTVTQPFTCVTPLILPMFEGKLLTGKATMRYE